MHGYIRCRNACSEVRNIKEIIKGKIMMGLDIESVCVENSRLISCMKIKSRKIAGTRKCGTVLAKMIDRLNIYQLEL